jgi:TonB family protein
MFKKLVYLLCLLAYSITGSGQSVKYFSIRGLSIADADSSFYYVEKLSGTTSDTDTLKFYYSSSKKILAIQFMKNRLLEGSFNYYYENGQLKLKGLNRNGKPIGEVLSYYSDGKPKAIIGFEPTTDPINISQNFKILRYWDEQGSELVKDGEGICKCEFDMLSSDYDFLQDEVPKSERQINWFYKDFEIQHQWEGKVKNGLRNSIWKAYRNGTLELEEQYNNGNFEFGKRFDGADLIEYESLEEAAEPENGLISFYKFVGKTMRYPAEARRKGIEGKVFIEFVVNHDGSLSNINSIQAPHAVLADEAIRVVRMAPKWKPGKQRGKVVRQKMVVPLIFRLG